MTSQQTTRLNTAIRTSLNDRFSVGIDKLAALPGDAIRNLYRALAQSDHNQEESRIAATLRTDVVPEWYNQLRGHSGSTPDLINFAYTDIIDGKAETACYGITELTSAPPPPPPFFEDPGYRFGYFHEFEATPGYTLYGFDLVERYLPMYTYGDELFDEDSPVGEAYSLAADLVLGLNRLLLSAALDRLAAEGLFTAPLGGIPITLSEYDGEGRIEPIYVIP